MTELTAETFCNVSYAFIAIIAAIGIVYRVSQSPSEVAVGLYDYFLSGLMAVTVFVNWRYVE